MRQNNCDQSVWYNRKWNVNTLTASGMIFVEIAVIFGSIEMTVSVVLTDSQSVKARVRRNHVEYFENDKRTLLLIIPIPTSNPAKQDCMYFSCTLSSCY